jgi:hypothetical protein
VSGGRFAFGMAAVVAVAVALGIAVLGSPALARARRLDALRTRDLSSLAGLTNQYWIRHQALPPDLETLAREPEEDPFPADPETRAAYAYRITGDRTWELCATFAAADDPDVPPGFWDHGAGEHCFAFEARKE